MLVNLLETLKLNNVPTYKNTRYFSVINKFIFFLCTINVKKISSKRDHY